MLRAFSSTRRAALAVFAMMGLVVTLVASPLAGLVAGARPRTSSGSFASRSSSMTTRPAHEVLSARLSRLSQQAPTAQGGQPDSSSGAMGTLALGVADSGAGSIRRGADGRLLVEVSLFDRHADTLARVRAAGVEILASPTDALQITGAVADDHLAALATVLGVRSVREMIVPAVDLPPAAAVVNATATTTATASAGPLACGTGVVSEGDQQLRAAEARAAFGVDGSGVTVGVLSDSFGRSPLAVTSAASDVVSGELPGPGNACYPTAVKVQNEFALTSYQPTDEGRALMQIIHDLAPGSPLIFSSGVGGEADMAAQIRQLAANGAKVIVDDISYPFEPLYQDGTIAKAIDDVTAAGVTYVSSASNNNIIIDGQDVASYEATGGYRPTACPAVLVGLGAVDCHDFDPGAGVANSNAITLAPKAVLQVELGWNEPVNGVTTDLDLYLVNPANPNIPTGDNTYSTVTGSPTKWFRYQNDTDAPQTVQLSIARKAGSTATPRFKYILQRPSAPTAVQWGTSQGGDIVGPTIYGHNAPLSGATVAAVRYDDPTLIEKFSSRGPATYCWAPVTGNTAAAAPLPGGCRDKPIDVAASNGVRTSFFATETAPNEFRFYGSSAAAGHVAAVAALQRERDPCRSPAELIAAQRASGRSVGAFGPDAAGSGLVDAVAAVGGLAPCPPMVAVKEKTSVVEGDVVTLDWSTSTSVPSGHPLSTSFVQTGGPRLAAVREDHTDERRFVAPRAASSDPATPTELTFAITATDTITGATTTMPVVVGVTNSVPTARGTGPAAVTVGDEVVLQGSSTDGHEPDRPAAGDGTGRAYSWRQIEGSPVTLVPGADATFRNATFLASVPGRHRFELVVTDHGGLGASSAPWVVTVDVRAPAGPGTVSGVVRDDHDVPLADATVVAFGRSHDGWREWMTTSDANGAWAIAGLTDGARYRISASKAGYGPRWTSGHLDLADRPMVVGPTSTADFILPVAADQGTVTGSVTTSAGAPAVGVRVDLYGPVGSLARTTTDASGTYRITGVTPGDRYRVRVTAADRTYERVWATTDGRGTAVGWSNRPSLFFTVGAGSVALVPTVVASTRAEARALTLSVRGPDQQPVAGVEVWLYSAGPDPGFEGWGYTDADGTLVVSGLRPGSYIAWAWTGCADCPVTGAGDQWFNGVPGGPWDLSDKLADPIDLRAADQSVVFILR